MESRISKAIYSSYAESSSAGRWGVLDRTLEPSVCPQAFTLSWYT